MTDIGAVYLDDARGLARFYKQLADRALAQVDDAAFHAVGEGPESNSIAIIVKHMAGNLRSRWTDFLTTDGEKPDRHRDTEFLVADGDDRAALTAAWERGWAAFIGTLDGLTADDLGATVVIRGEPHSVVAAIQRGLTHAAYHAGQIVFLAREAAGAEWSSLSIPRGQSEKFTKTMHDQQASGGTSSA